MQDLTEIVKSSLHGRLDIALINKITPYVVKGLEEAYKPDINSDERTRLVELLTVINEDATLTCPRYSTESTLEDCKGCRYDKEDGSCDYVEREADYLLANGAIVPPCKVGDTLYEIITRDGGIRTTKVVGFHLGKFPDLRGHKRKEYIICYSGYSLTHIDIDKFGKTVFLTREEAEAKLKEGVQK